jgi:hypothetical protein
MSADPSDEKSMKVVASFLKDKSALLLRYVNDLIAFAAKSQDIDTKAYLAVQEELKIKSDKECHMVLGRYQHILDKYQELPSVLDPILEQMVSPIMLFMRDYVRKAVAAQNYVVPAEVKALVFAMCHLCKVRGYKTVIKFFPHEVSDMEPVTELLHFQDVFALNMERT